MCNSVCATDTYPASLKITLMCAAYKVMAYVVMAYVVMAYIVMVYTVVAYVVMAYILPLNITSICATL